MAHWLLKSEPATWSWDDQLACGLKGTHWDGVRNHQAANNMKAMTRGDHAFFYHSGDERRIVGIVEIIKTYYPDPSDETNKFGMVDVKAIAGVPKPVTLADIKAEPKLKEFALVRQGRLSVVPVTSPEWALLCKMGGVKSR